MTISHVKYFNSQQHYLHFSASYKKVQKNKLLLQLVYTIPANFPDFRGILPILTFQPDLPIGILKKNPKIPIFDKVTRKIII